jgi:uncharacterized RDD family membrane protein YckC
MRRERRERSIDKVSLMRNPLNKMIAIVLSVLLGTSTVFAAANDSKPADKTPQVSVPTAAESTPVEASTPTKPDDAATDDNDDDNDDVHIHHHHRHHNGNDVVHIGSDSHLPAGQKADSVVSVGGSSSSAGEVGDAVVSVFGNTTVSGGSVGDAAVAVFGDTHVNGKVGQDVVAVFGDVELGPNAEVGGQVVVVGGTLTRDPAATVHGSVQEVSLPMGLGHMEWLRQWIKECLFLGRPLAFHAGLEWAWTLALGFLAFYAVLALLFPKGIARCAETFETQPGKTILASILTLIATPIAFTILIITGIGIVLVPILGGLLFFAGLFGKAVILATIGRRVTKNFGEPEFWHEAVAVLIGGALMLLLYTIPFVGFIVQKAFGILGLGVVVYTLLLAQRARRAAARPQTPTPPPAGVPGSGATDALAASTDSAASAGAAAFASAEASGTDTSASAAAAPDAGAAPATSVPPLQSSAPLSTAAALALPRAGFGIRMLALLIDVVLIGVLIHFFRHSHDLMLILLATYAAIMWKLKGTTVGGIVCHLQVVRADGRELDWSTAIVRALGCFLSLFVVFLGFIWIAIDPDKQAWHDKIAGTVVVRTTQSAGLV